MLGGRDSKTCRFGGVVRVPPCIESLLLALELNYGCLNNIHKRRPHHQHAKILHPSLEKSGYGPEVPQLTTAN